MKRRIGKSQISFQVKFLGKFLASSIIQLHRKSFSAKRSLFVWNKLALKNHLYAFCVGCILLVTAMLMAGCHQNGMQMPLVDIHADPSKASSNGKKEGAASAAGGLTYRKDILPIIEAKCTPCHAAGSTYDWYDYNKLKGSSKKARDYVQPGGSLQMPPAAAPKGPLSNQQIETIVKWIDSGAPEGAASDVPAAPPKIASAPNTVGTRPLADSGVTQSTLAIPAQVNTCFGCHGDRGQSNQPDYPSLAGQNAEYIVQQLLGFTQDLRKNPEAQMMKAMAGALSDADRTLIADYFAAEKAMSFQGPSKDSALLLKGQYVYEGKTETGEPKEGAIACMTCHGATGEGVGGTPRLAGQSSAYLAKQLLLFKNELRSNALMNMVAKSLSDEEMQTVASYLEQMKSGDKK